MRILTARLTGFRNLADGDYEFSPGVNLLIGSNGQGKTNLLEALNFAAFGRSHRGARSEELIRFTDQHLHVSLAVDQASGVRQDHEFGLDREGGRRFRIDGQLVTRRADLVGRLATVFFRPESVELVRDGPEARRRFADQSLASLDSGYLAALMAYQRALRQKGRLLADVRRGARREADAARELAAWNADLAVHAVPIGRRRGEWSSLLAPYADAIYQDLAGSPAPLEFQWRPRLQAFAPARLASATDEELAADILAEFDYIRPMELRRGRPLAGLQFDDFLVRLGERDLRVFGSQGETRTAAISLVLAQSDVVFRQRRVRPVLFLDDIFSELDRERARRLQERSARNHQVFIATARADDVAGWEPDPARRWLVEDGRLTALP
ncbi:MAG TPA: DNA replication and repair protein RecF [Candidatus Krumholzibacteria bacterium]|nr:DNA replication and repair protein RecF [Candidatus Krumholzibacteria bacterium]HPD73009.1 DNA replication and repair protein RecF [Candidatus Krumholzibacteria bacterium]HRY41808.1 DNA replication and repair protein RecF [Candidatus Krumholzibacteria bacterium]